MLDFVARLFDDAGALSPHGICLLWRPELIWTHVTSDAVIGVAYLSIPLAIAWFVSKRPDVAFGWVFWCFVTFILACGTTHFLSIVTLWFPIYGIEAVVKVITALASIATALALWPLLPRALAFPSHSELRAANAALAKRVNERDRALEALERATAERQYAEEMLRQSQKMEALGQLTGGVAHDFNNMLCVVLANLERVERKLPADSELLQPLRNALAGAERAGGVTRQLLAFARKQPLEPRKVEVAALIDGVSGLLEGALGSRIELRTRVESSLWPVMVDPNQLENAILNLAVNARDALSGGEGSVTISARNLPACEMHGMRNESDGVLIEVEDDGAGMTTDVLERAFDPFFTTKPEGHGTGLGLSQVFGFVRQSGGDVTIESARGTGTRVMLFLPRPCEVMA